MTMNFPSSNLDEGIFFGILQPIALSDSLYL